MFIPICSNPPSGMILSFEECSFCFKSFPPSLFFPLFFTYSLCRRTFCFLSVGFLFQPFRLFLLSLTPVCFLLCGCCILFRAISCFFSAARFSIVSVISLRFSSAVRFSVIFSCFFKIQFHFLIYYYSISASSINSANTLPKAPGFICHLPPSRRQHHIIFICNLF